MTAFASASPAHFVACILQSLRRILKLLFFFASACHGSIRPKACFQQTWKSMRKVASLALTHLTVHHHIAASINSSFHLELVERKEEKKRTSAPPKSSTAEDRSPALSIYHRESRYEAIPTNSSLCYAKLCLPVW